MYVCMMLEDTMCIVYEHMWPPAIGEVLQPYQLEWPAWAVSCVCVCWDKSRVSATLPVAGAPGLAILAAQRQRYLRCHFLIWQSDRPHRAHSEKLCSTKHQLCSCSSNQLTVSTPTIWLGCASLHQGSEFGVLTHSLVKMLAYEVYCQLVGWVRNN